MTKKNLLVITTTFPRWKNDTDPPFVFELARRLTRLFHVTVLTPCYPGALADEVMEEIRVYRFRYFLKNWETLAGSEGILPTLKKNKLFYLLVPFFVVAEFLALMKLIRRIKPDVIHAHWILPQGFVTALAHKFTGVPFVITTHGGDIYGLQGKLATTLKDYALRHANAVTVVSSDIQKTIQQTFGDAIHTEVIPMGVDSQLFHPSKNDPQIKEKFGITGFFLLYVGRLTAKKGVRYLIEAMPEVIRHHPETKLLIIGSGEEKQRLQQLTRQLALTDNIIFAGALPNQDLPAYFATADIFIGPSVKVPGGDREGFGLTFVEAALSGCVVIGTNVGGITDIIADGKTGYLVPEKSPDAIAEKIIMILGNPDKAGLLKLFAREQLLQQFDWQVTAEHYAKILDDKII